MQLLCAFSKLAKPENFEKLKFKSGLFFLSLHTVVKDIKSAC